MSHAGDPRRIVDSGNEFGSLRDAIRAEQADPGADAETLRRIGFGLEQQVATQAAGSQVDGVLRAGLQFFSRKGAFIALAAVAVVGTGAATLPAVRSPSANESPSVLTSRTPNTVESRTSAPRVLALEETRSAPELTVPPMPSIAPADLPSAPPAALAVDARLAKGSPSSAKAASRREIVAGAPSTARSSDAVETSGASASSGDEIELLAEAHNVLHAKPQESLALCEKMRTQYASGHFAQEREAVAIEALVYLHRVAEAEKRWTEFRQRYPMSSHRVHLASLFEQNAAPAR